MVLKKMEDTAAPCLRVKHLDVLRPFAAVVKDCTQFVSRTWWIVSTPLRNIGWELYILCPVGTFAVVAQNTDTTHPRKDQDSIVVLLNSLSS